MVGNILIGNPVDIMAASGAANTKPPPPVQAASPRSVWSYRCWSPPAPMPEPKLLVHAQHQHPTTMVPIKMALCMAGILKCEARTAFEADPNMIIQNPKEKYRAH